MVSSYPTGGASRLSGTRQATSGPPMNFPSHIMNRDFARAMSLPRHQDRQTFGKREFVPTVPRPAEEKGNRKALGRFRRALRHAPLTVGALGLVDFLDYLSRTEGHLVVPDNYELYRGPCGPYHMACALALIPICPLVAQACSPSNIVEKPADGTSVLLPNQSAWSFGMPNPILADRYDFTRSYLRIDNDGRQIEWFGDSYVRVPVVVPTYGLSPVHRPLPFEFYEPWAAPYPAIPSLPASEPRPGDQDRQTTNGGVKPPVWPVITTVIRPPPVKPPPVVDPSRPPPVVETKPDPGRPPPVVVKPPVEPPDLPRPPGPRTKERKLKLFGPGRIPLAIVNFVTEGMDFVQALHKALPDECKAKPVALVSKELRGQFSWKQQARNRSLQRRIEANRGNVIKSKIKLTERQKAQLEATVPANMEVYTKPRLRKDGTFKVFRTHRAPNTWEMAQAVYKCIDHMPDAALTKFFRDAFVEVGNENAEDLFYGKLGKAMAEGAGRSKIGAIGGYQLGPAI